MLQEGDSNCRYFGNSFTVHSYETRSIAGQVGMTAGGERIQNMMAIQKNRETSSVGGLGNLKDGGGVSWR